MAQESLKVIIASRFDNKAFLQANKATNKLEKDVKNLSRTLGYAFSAAAVISFGKASVKAFAEDDKAARSLTQTLTNLGMEMQAINASKFISELEKTYAVLDDKLRPAFQKLLGSTQDYKQAQSLLITALNVAAGTGKDLESVINALSKAAVGSNTALLKLGVGLNQTQLKAMDLAQIQEYLNTLFANQATLAADSYAGSLDRITISANNVKEIIGKGLVDAFSALGGSGGLKQTLQNVENVATALADLTVGIGRFISLVNLLVTDPSLNPLNTIKKAKAMMDKWRKEDATTTSKTAKLSTNASNTVLKNTKEIAKIQKDTAKLAGLQGLFDPQQLQIMAALQGKITDEEKKRLELMLALETGNTAEAEKLAKQLAAAQGQLSIFSLYLRTLPDAKNPFASWMDYLKMLEDRIKVIGQIEAKAGQTPLTLAEFQMASPQAQERAAALEASDAAAAAADALKALAEAERQASTAGVSTSGGSINITVNGAIDPESVSRQIVDILNQSTYRGSGGSKMLQNTL